MSRDFNFLWSHTQTGAVAALLHTGNHGDDSGDDDNRLDLHNTQQFMKHNHIRYSISFDPMKKATQGVFLIPVTQKNSLTSSCLQSLSQMYSATPKDSDQTVLFICLLCIWSLGVYCYFSYPARAKKKKKSIRSTKSSRVNVHQVTMCSLESPNPCPTPPSQLPVEPKSHD